jgi:hypothetical protein
LILFLSVVANGWPLNTANDKRLKSTVTDCFVVF